MLALVSCTMKIPKASHYVYICVYIFSWVILNNPLSIFLLLQSHLLHTLFYVVNLGIGRWDDSGIQTHLCLDEKKMWCDLFVSTRLSSISLNCDQIQQKVRSCLNQCSIAIERQHGHSNSYIRKLLIGAYLEFQRFSPISAWWETWQHSGRHSTGQAAESSVFELAGSYRERHWGWLEHWKPQSPQPVTHFQQ